MAGENTNDGQAGATGAGAAGAAGTGGVANPNPGAAGTASNNGAAAGAAASEGNARPGAAASGFTYKEDRTDWVPKHRFNEVNEKARRSGELEAALADRDRKIAALAGVAPQDPNAAKQDQVKEAFIKLYPQLEPLLTLSKEQIAQLTQTPQHLTRAAEIENREWARHGKTQMSTLYSSIADSIGAESLNDDQKADLRDSFTAWFKNKCQSELQASGGESSATLQRYEEGDGKLLDEFAKRYAANWVEPARRRVTAQTLARTRPVPNSQGRSQVSTTQRPEKFESLDARIEYAAKVAKERGMAFGG